MFSKVIFTNPENVAANRKGEVTEQQRKVFLREFSFYAFGALVILGVGAGLLLLGKNLGMAVICLLAGGGMLFVTRDSWTLYRDPQPRVECLRGMLRPAGRIPVNKGGHVHVGDHKLFLSREQLKEVRFGHPYDIYVLMPYNKAVSATALEFTHG